MQWHHLPCISHWHHCCVIVITVVISVNGLMRTCSSSSFWQNSPFHKFLRLPVKVVVRRAKQILTLVLCLVVKKAPSSVLASLKLLSRVGRSRFITFPEYEWVIRCSSQVVDRCIGSCLPCRQTHTNYFLNYGEILSPCWLIRPNVSQSK